MHDLFQQTALLCFRFFVVDMLQNVLQISCFATIYWATVVMCFAIAAVMKFVRFKTYCHQIFVRERACGETAVGSSMSEVLKTCSDVTVKSSEQVISS